MARVIIDPEGEETELDGPPPSAAEIIKMLSESLSDETGLPIDFLKNGERSKVREALNVPNKALKMKYRNRGYPIGDKFMDEEDVRELRQSVRESLKRFQKR